ncbi:MAG: hypothetical protein CMH56_07380 [Myxococcales bacterium]|nr:hypothetical protein [Myxococcales bacterium]
MRGIQNIKLIGAAMALFLSVPSVAQNQPIRVLQSQGDLSEISLHEAVKEALSKNEDLVIADENITQQNYAALETWSYLLPTWTISGQKQYNSPEQTVEFQSAEQLENQALLYDSIAEMMEQNAAMIPDPSTQADLQEQAEGLRDVSTELRSTDVEPTVITPAEVFNADTTLRVPLFNGRAFPALRNAYSRLDIAHLSKEQMRQGIAQATVMAYYMAWLSQENLESARRQLTRSQEHVAATQRRVDAGILPISNLHRANLEAIQADQGVKEAVNRLAQSKGALGFVMGRENDFNLQEPQVVSDAIIEEEKTLIERAMKQRPDVKIQRVSLIMSERLRHDAWLRFLPSFNLVAQTRYTDNTAGFISEPYNSTVTVQGSFTLFEGGQRFMSLQSSASRIRQERTKLEKLQRDVRAQLRAMIKDIETKKEVYAQAVAAKKMAEKTRNNVVHTQMSGLATQLEVLDANHALFLSELRQTQARLQLDLAFWALRDAQGNLVGEFSDNAAKAK